MQLVYIDGYDNILKSNSVFEANQYRYRVIDSFTSDLNGVSTNYYFLKRENSSEKFILIANANRFDLYDTTYGGADLTSPINLGVYQDNDAIIRFYNDVVVKVGQVINKRYQVAYIRKKLTLVDLSNEQVLQIDLHSSTAEEELRGFGIRIIGNRY